MVPLHHGSLHVLIIDAKAKASCSSSIVPVILFAYMCPFLLVLVLPALHLSLLPVDEEGKLSPNGKKQKQC